MSKSVNAASIAQEQQRQQTSGCIPQCITATEARCQISITDDFRRFLADFFTEATAGMLVNAFRGGEFPKEDLVVYNLTVMLNALPDILRKAAEEVPPFFSV